MRAKKTYLLLTALSLTLPLYGTVTLQLSGSSIQDSSETPAPIGSKIIVVADTNNDGFTSNIFDGDSLETGSLLGDSTNDYIVFAADALAINVIPGLFSFNASGINVTDGPISAGNNFAIYWFPDMQAATTSATVGSEFGIYSGGSWQLPSDGNSLPYTASGTFLATEVVAAVPEPTTYAMFTSIALLCFAWIRRRK